MADPPQIVPETVDALLDVLWKLLDDEGSREGSVNVRGVGVVGFAGVGIGLAATVAKAALDPRLPAGWRFTSLGLFVCALLMLVAVAVYTLMAVLLPRDRPTLGIEEVERYPTWAAISRPVEIEQGRAMNGLLTSLTDTRAINDAKARALRWSYRGLVGGLVLLSVLGLILGLRYAGVIELHHA